MECYHIIDYRSSAASSSFVTFQFDLPQGGSTNPTKTHLMAFDGQREVDVDVIFVKSDALRCLPIQKTTQLFLIWGLGLLRVLSALAERCNKLIKIFQ